MNLMQAYRASRDAARAAVLDARGKVKVGVTMDWAKLARGIKPSQDMSYEEAFGLAPNFESTLKQVRFGNAEQDERLRFVFHGEGNTSIWFVAGADEPFSTFRNRLRRLVPRVRKP